MPITIRIARTIVFGFVLFFAAVGQSFAATQYTPLHGFAGAPGDGGNPQYGSLATDGTLLYGMTLNGGVSNNGAVFKMNLTGSSYQVLHSFTGLSFTDIFLGGHGNTNDGSRPYGTPLLIGSTLYGTTSSGGTNGTGTIFKINTDGNGFQLLHHFGAGFGPNDGFQPYCTLVTDGTTLYGMTTTSSSGLGTIFSISTNGSAYHIMHNFGPGTNDGAAPQGSLTISGTTLYGMTQMGGSLSSGIIFKIGTDGGGFQLIHTFTGLANDGSGPYGSLTLDNSTLYGMTANGGANNVGAVFSLDVSGSNFKIVHSFALGNTWQPYGDVLVSGSTLYGMTHVGGTNGLGLGTIFQVNADGGGFQILHTFFFAPPINAGDGSTPSGSLSLIGSLLYGMTYFGGSTHNAGVIFSFNPTGGGGGGGSVGGLKVNILPATAVKAGAEWQVDGGAFSKSGSIVTSLTAGAHTVSFKAVKGFAPPANQIVMVALGTTNTITGTYTEVDSTPPVLKVISPTSKTSVNSGAFTASGTASDNVGVALVLYQLNGGAWTQASSASSFANWTAPNLNLVAGVNVFKAYARDLNGNLSPTNTVSFTYVVSAVLAVNANLPGAGTFKPNLNGQSLQIGKVETISVKAAKGYSFVNWTGSTNTTSAKITFVMASNLTFTANFRDTTRPTCVVLSPLKNQSVTSAAPVASGRAMDNVGVTQVRYQINGGAWLPAIFADGTNWHTDVLSLLSGPNTISAYAVDAAGNASLTNTIAFTRVIQLVADWAPDSFNGLLATVTPGNGSPESVGFDVHAFAQASTSGSTESEDYGGGTYTYLKIDTNLAQLSLAFTTPPASSNTMGAIDLVFTNHYAGYFSNEDGGDLGQISLSVAPGFVPASVVGKTLNAVSSDNGKTTKIKMTTAVGFTKTPSNNSNSGTSSGTYVFARFSPVCGIFAFSFTNAADAGQTAYVQLTFTSTKGGTYFVMTFDSLGVLQDVDTGHFTM